MGPLISFIRHFFGLSKGWFAWVAVMIAANGVAPFFFWQASEARITLAVFLTGAVIMFGLFLVSGFTRLLGAAHVMWLGLVPWLALRLHGADLGQPMAQWMLAVVVINGLSLVLDVRDVYLYRKGDRQPVVSL